MSEHDTSPSDHDPRVVVVTGASSGIGRATAVRAASAGDHVVLVARGREALEEAAAECEEAGAASTLVLTADVGDDAQVADVVRAVLTEHGQLDAVVNSAGVVSYGRTEEVPADVFDGVIRTNLLGSVNVARHVIPVLRSQEEGTLVLVGSVIGHIAVPTMSPYVVSKWGIRALGRQLELENRDLPDVHIEYVAPGGVDTPIYQQAANFAGFEGRPPPPVSSPERVAQQIVDSFDRPRLRSQLSLANEVIRFGFAVLPAVYDTLVAPLFDLAAKDLDRPVEPHNGNVLDTQQDGNQVHGDQGSALGGLARNLVRMVQEVAVR
ncbi:SDR family NAD(P)-dependent oxidoreductase [Nocardioides dongkuii]|uniref:SDR family NAD(P)-dependent oxidoreductase n=1 Tax=Nocardioides dongkuii TaxID=2760089 RepID=UPI0015FB3B7D|nr:SDR family NAD(P)-dependent oxidoreductase [Nocardioides dongkuii]